MGSEGSISPHLVNLFFFHALDLCNNGLSGLVSLQFGRLFGLRELLLHRNGSDAHIPTDCLNFVSYNFLSGSILAGLGLLAQVKSLYLVPNNATGSIPSTLGDLSALTELELNKNGVRGGIPQQLGMLTNLSILYFCENQSTGHIPSSLSNISAVISKNSFTGVIPQEFGILPNLQVLHLYESQLGGQIPASLSNSASLQNLELLDLSQNKLIGSIPREAVGLQSLTSLIKLQNLQVRGLCTNFLSNTVLKYSGRLKMLHYIDLSFNNLTRKILEGSFANSTIVESVLWVA